MKTNNSLNKYLYSCRAFTALVSIMTSDECWRGNQHIENTRAWELCYKLQTSPRLLCWFALDLTVSYWKQQLRLYLNPIHLRIMKVGRHWLIIINGKLRNDEFQPNFQEPSSLQIFHYLRQYYYALGNLPQNIVNTNVPIVKIIECSCCTEYVGTCNRHCTRSRSTISTRWTQNTSTGLLWRLVRQLSKDFSKPSRRPFQDSLPVLEHTVKAKHSSTSAKFRCCSTRSWMHKQLGGV